MPAKSLHDNRPSLEELKTRRQMLKLVGRHVPPPPGARPPARWGTEDGIRELLGAGPAELAFTTASVTQRFPSPEFFADFFVEYYGPTLKASEALTQEGRRAFRDDLIALGHRVEPRDGRHADLPA